MNSQTARSVSGSCRGPVTKSENPGDFLPAKRFHDGVGSRFRRFEMNGDGLIAPWIFELLASIGDVDKLHAEPASGIFKTARLVA